LITFIVVIFVFSVLILVHELGHMLAAKKMGVRVERFSLGFGKKLFSVKKGDTEYMLSLFPFGGYVKMAGDNPAECKGAPDEFYSKSPIRRFLIIVAGSLTNYFFAFLVFAAIFMAGVPSLTTIVGQLLPDYPALQSGLAEGDFIYEIDGNKVKYWHELVQIVQRDTDGKPLLFRVERKGKTIDFEIAPKVISTKNIFGQETKIGMIGVAPREEIIFVKHNLFQAISMGGRKLFAITGMTYKGLWLILTGGMPVKESVAGPIGIAFLIGKAAKLGFIHLLSIMAHINVALAIFNLLPIPILDGGHVMFLAIEKLRGRPVSPRTQEMVGQVALYILIAFILFVSWNDISRLLPFKR